MKRFLPYAFAATLLTLGACNADNKAVETTATDTSASGDTAVVINDGMDSEAMYRSRARRVADRVYTDFKMTDTTVRTRLTTVYYNRAKRMGDLRAKYAVANADTAGQYQAMRDAEMESNKEFQPIFTDPKVYTDYETKRSDYDRYMMEDEGTTGGTEGAMSEGKMSDGAMSDGKMSDGKMSSSDAGMASGAMEDGKAKVKIKGEDGSKIKIKDGDVKYRDADGEKTKVNGN